MASPTRHKWRRRILRGLVLAGVLLLLAGRCLLAVRKGNFWSVPLVHEIFQKLGWPPEWTSISDAQGVFQIHGPVIEIHRIVMANAVAGLECTGGQYDTRDDILEADIITGTFLSRNPLVTLLLGDMRDKLLAQHVRGPLSQWGQPTFTALPRGQIPAHSVDWLRSIAIHGGQIGNGILQAFGSLYNAIRPPP